MDWHHSKLLRREEQARRQKQRKRQWLKKMYALGRAEGGGGMRGTGCTGRGAAARAGDEGRGAPSPAGWSGSEEEEADFEGGVDEMLKWSESLDFDSYHQGWLGLATSARPEWSGEAVAY